MGLDDLIARLEKATGPDRELDDAIKIAHAAFLLSSGKGAAETVEAVGCNLREHPRPYTASIDAALTLVPENHRWSVSGEEVDGAGETLPPTAFVSFYGSDFRLSDSSDAASPAIALCIAGLKARARTAQESQ